jgi:hypothetical protein
MRNKPGRLVMLGLLLAMAPGPEAWAKDDRADPAQVRVSGLGLWRNREMRVALERMLGPERGPAFDANAIEDTAFLLYSIVNDEGYQHPVILIHVELAAGKTQTWQLDASLDVDLPRDLQAKTVRFEVRMGPRSYLEEVNIEGLHALRPEEGEAFFKPGNTLIASRAARAYSPSRLRRSAEKLREALRQRGHTQAEVEARQAEAEGATDGPVFTSR